MRTLVYGILALVVCTFFVACLILLTGSISVDYSTAWLGVAGVIVAVAALSQVIFAVVVYFESVTLRYQMERLHKEATQQHENNHAQIQKYKDAFHDAAKASIIGLMEALTYSERGEGFQAAMKQLKLAQINIEIAHGTYITLWSAMQNSFKLSKKHFLNLEAELWERASQLPQGDRERIRKEYGKLK